MRLLFGLALALASCTHSSSVTCDDGRICPADTVCVSLTVQAVSPDQCAPSGSIDACANLADFAPCTNAGVAGVCYPTTGGHACLPSGCGNGILDANEVCDDGNAVAGDGCSDSCKSNETCGNGVVDPVTGEVCDDGNHQSHDGCAQTCGQTEAPSWIQHSIKIPDPRTGVAMAYDASTQQIVMFGGRLGNASLGDTWIMTNGWGASTELGPAARAFAAVAYDSARHRVVLFGGELQNGLSFPTFPLSYYGDTWEWDGAHWLQAASADAPHPSARSHHSMAYDPVRKRVVLFGGATSREGGGSAAMNDTWEWDGTTWTQITSADATAPSGRKDAALGYDPTAGKMVLLGGQLNRSPERGETWTLRRYRELDEAVTGDLAAGTLRERADDRPGEPSPVDVGRTRCRLVQRGRAVALGRLDVDEALGHRTDRDVGHGIRDERRDESGRRLRRYRSSAR